MAGYGSFTARNENTGEEHETKRDDSTGQIMAQKRDGKRFKGVRELRRRKFIWIWRLTHYPRWVHFIALVANDYVPSPGESFFFIGLEA